MTPWQEVGERCYRRRYESLDLNIGVVRGSDALLLIDTRCHDREAAELLDELRAFDTRPVRWIVNTHWHFDHTFGNDAIARGVRTAGRDLGSPGDARRAVALVGRSEGQMERAAAGLGA